MTGVVQARPLRRDAEANRQHILLAAGRLMAERGLAVPLEDIAVAAGVGIGTLYRRFPTRSDLVQALFLDRLAAYLADLESALAMGDGWDGLVWFLRRAAGRQVADRALSELMEGDLAPEPIRQLRERFVPLAEVLVARARATGRLRQDFTVTDLIFAQKMVAAIGGTTLPVSETAWERYLTLVVDGLVTSREAPTPAAPPLTLEQVRRLHEPRS